MNKKSFVSVLLLISLFCMMLSACYKNGSSTITQNVNNKTESALQTVSVENEEKTTEKELKPISSGNLNIKDGKFEIFKTDFESRYSEDFLTEINSLISLKFGYEDYYNWNGDAEKVVNELINCCVSASKFPFRMIETEDKELLKKATEELRVIFDDESINITSGIVEIETLNAYIKDMFGENARSFMPEDFDVAVKYDKEKILYANESYSYITYLPQSDLLHFTSRETGFSSYSSFIYDITEKDGDYIVYTLGKLEDYGFVQGFAMQQAYMFEYLNWETGNHIPAFEYTVGVSENGDLYLKSVNKKCIYAKDFCGDYRVTADTVLYDRRVYTQPFYRVDTVKKGTVVTIGKDYIKENYEYIVNEEFSGYINPDHLEEIE